MSTEEGIVWAQRSKSEPVRRVGKMTREDAIVRVEALMGEGYEWVTIEPVRDWLQNPTTPGEYFEQFRDGSEPLLLAKHRGGSTDKRPFATGPWAPDEWTAVLATDPAVIAALSKGPKSVKALIAAVVAAGFEAPTPANIRRHLKRLGYKVLKQKKKRKGPPVWGR